MTWPSDVFLILGKDNSECILHGSLEDPSRNELLLHITEINSVRYPL